ncbi:MAG: class 1 isoprenoid biosynthesis enzyme [Thermoflavifilum sp.]|nr:class 1 isoprenoid biosynthesis enzyme [Thermoflavifilum sp.]
MSFLSQIRFTITLLFRALYILIQRKRETKKAISVLQNEEAEMQHKLSKELFKKIVVSYGIYNPIVVEGFTRLHGRKPTEIEKQRMIYYFICSSLFDDFIDQQHMPAERLYALSFSPEKILDANHEERLFIKCHHWLYQQVNQQQSYTELIHKLFAAQADSRKQLHSNIPTKEVLDITFQKGGYAVELCSYYLEENISCEERNIWFQVGVLIQLINDLFDAWKDSSQNIVSSVWAIQDMYIFEKVFVEQVMKLWKMIRSLPISDRHKSYLILSLSGTLAFGYIAIQQLKHIQSGQTHLPKYNPSQRKYWIIDMEKTKNLLSWVKWTHQLFQQAMHLMQLTNSR